MSHIKDVEKFHKKFGLLRSKTPRQLTQRKLQERVEFMQEELDEFAVGMINKSFEAQADALIDLVYVAMGTAVMMGLPWKELWDDVQRANMSKVRGTTHRGHAVDVCKPKGWQGPQTMRILSLRGYLDHAPEADDPEHEAIRAAEAITAAPMTLGEMVRENNRRNMDYGFDEGDAA